MDGESLPGITEGEVCLVVTGEASWTVTTAPPQTVKQVAPAFAESELLQALLILAQARNRQGELRTAHIVWNRMTPYFFRGGSLGIGQTPDLQWRTIESLFNTAVTDEVGATARELYTALAKAPPKHVGVFVRRLVSACLVYNATSEDRLIDAAVAWEALFGSRDHDQLTVQLALAMAWMLAPEDYEDRLTTYRRAKTIYRTRSRLVHGNADMSDVPQAAADLIEWLRQVFVALLTTHSSLLADPNRTLRIFLREPTNLT
jgi:hypothetical protein